MQRRGSQGSKRFRRGTSQNVMFYEDRRSSKRSFGNCESHGQNDLKRFKEDHEHVHPDLIEVKNFLSQMKAHWKTQKMNKDEEDIMIANVLKQTLAKEALLAKSESYHLNSNVAEFLTRSRELAVIARFMRAFNIEKTPPQHKTIKIFEALMDSVLDYFRSPEKFVSTYESDEENEETTVMSDQITDLRDRYFTFLTTEAELETLICHHKARFVISLSVTLAAALEIKKVIKKFVKHIFGNDAERMLTNADSFIVVASVLRHAGKFGLSKKCITKVLQFVDKISQTNPGIISGMFEALEDKDEFVEIYDKLANKWTFELLTKNGSVAKACARFDIKQSDYSDKLFAAMTEREGGSEQNFIFLIRNLSLGPMFKVICNFKAQQKVLRALDDLSAQELFNLACSSHVHLLEAVVASETIGEKVKLKMLSRLVEKSVELAVDKFGSRLLDAVMINCQVKTIRVIAAELIKHKKTLLGDRIGKFIFLHWGLNYFEDNNKDAWNNVISNSKYRKRQKLLSVLSSV
ncbi:uncharacterized protein LOC111269440 isoform X2 [Varroa jacobsoni]|uniref:Nucleolar protein 9 n=1 Tax=Varroa destructor TaxID=109461 RepID=A0A7M7KYR8_VARDE|nr:uncharacterized protein LOC111255308 isoform X2 [Varroa destructor]XP_022704772.1 uncharacterized protein LOC111269440 isoform X2 [Varroa jacobsoni]